MTTHMIAQGQLNEVKLAEELTELLKEFPEQWGISPLDALSDVFLALRQRVPPANQEFRQWLRVRAHYALRKYIHQELSNRLQQTPRCGGEE